MTEETTAPPPNNAGYTVLGWLLFLAGVLVIVVALSMETSMSVENLDPNTLAFSTSQVENVGLMHRRMVLVTLGASSSLSGLLMLALARLGDATHYLAALARR